MAEYIDRETALQAFKNGPHDVFEELCDVCGFSDGAVKEILTSIPASDVVEVVRCRDCEYFEPSEASKGESGICMINRRIGINIARLGSEFCSTGEKRGE